MTTTENTTATVKMPATPQVLKRVEVLRHWANRTEHVDENERLAAQHRLAVLAEMYDLTGAGIRTSNDTEERWLFNPGAWMGSRYQETRGKTLTELAAMMRAEISLARKLAKKAAKPGELAVVDPLGDAPAQIKISIRTRYYSGGGSIDIVISNVPADWGWTMGENHYGDTVKIATPACDAFYRAVKAVHSQFNYDNSDAMTDYFDRRFYGHVDTAERIVFERW